MSNLSEQINRAIPPAAQGYDRGFRDALGSMILVLQSLKESPEYVSAIVLTMLDAYANNFDKRT